VTNNPAVKAVVPRFSDFDPYAHLVFPGGILNNRFVKEWNKLNQALDTNDICGVQEVKGLACEQLKTLNTGVKPVDKDKDKRLLAEAVKQHADNLNVYKAALQTTYRDGPFGKSGIAVEDFSSYNFKKDIERSKVAIYGWGSWLDAGTANGVFSRFMTFSNPQKVIIGSWNHGATEDTNPYMPSNTPVNPPLEQQFMDIVSFFDTYLKNNNGKLIPRELKYYTMGEEKWKTTKVWPPAGVTSQRWYLAANGSLTTAAPINKTGADTYTVNFSATTGATNRWFQSGKDIIYPDRANEDKKLLTYTSDRLHQDVEITGHPVVALYVTSTANDGAFYIYSNYKGS